MKILGITGGVGSGKSAVLSLFREKYGAVTRQLDEVARELQKKGTPCFAKIVSAFGREVLQEDGELNRIWLAEVAFEQPSKRELLNEIVHPEVRKWIVDDIEKQRQQQVSLYVIEAALLIEANYSEICDELWYIYADETIRRKRLKESRNYTDEKITQMMMAQVPEEIFLRNCTVMIDNSGDFVDTERQIEARI